MLKRISPRMLCWLPQVICKISARNALIKQFFDNKRMFCDKMRKRAVGKKAKAVTTPRTKREPEVAYGRGPEIDSDCTRAPGCPVGRGIAIHFNKFLAAVIPRAPGLRRPRARSGLPRACGHKGHTCAFRLQRMSPS